MLETVERDLALLAELGPDAQLHARNPHSRRSCDRRVTAARRDRSKARSPGKERRASMPTSPFAKGSRSESARSSIEPLYTPGHTDDHHAYLLAAADGARVFTGDALLIDGCGRTDFQNGDAATLYRSVHEKIFALAGRDAGLSRRTIISSGTSAASARSARAIRGSAAARASRNSSQSWRRSICRGRRRWTVAVPANRECGEVQGA